MTVHPRTFKMQIAIVVSEPCICFPESTEVVLAGYMHNVTERLARLVYKNDCYDIADRHDCNDDALYIYIIIIM